MYRSFEIHHDMFFIVYRVKLAQSATDIISNSIIDRSNNKSLDLENHAGSKQLLELVDRNGLTKITLDNC